MFIKTNMEFENLLNEIEQVIVKNNSLNNDTSINNNKESLKQVLYINSITQVEDLIKSVDRR